MLRKCLFLSGFHFFKLLTGLLDFCGTFHQQSKVSNDFVNFYSLLEDIFLILIFFFFFCFQITFSSTLCHSAVFPPKHVIHEPFVNIYWIAYDQQRPTNNQWPVKRNTLKAFWMYVYSERITWLWGNTKYMKCRFYL